MSASCSVFCIRQDIIVAYTLVSLCVTYLNSLVQVVATAGSGKTTVLKEYAQKRPHLRFLYVTYNKDMKEEKMAEFRDEDITNVEGSLPHLCQVDAPCPIRSTDCS